MILPVMLLLYFNANECHIPIYRFKTFMTVTLPVGASVNVIRADCPSGPIANEMAF